MENTDNTLEINLYDAWGNRPTNFMISRTNDDIKISLNVLIEIINSKEYYDKLYLIVDKIKYENFDKNLLIELEQLNQIHQKWFLYNIEIKKAKYPDYFSMFGIMKKYEYEKTEQQEYERTLLILDGIKVCLKVDGKTFYFTTPDRDSHPKLVAFVNETINLFTSKFLINPKKIISKI